MIPVAKPFLGKQEAAAAAAAVLSGWVTQGPRVEEFERAFARFTGARFACAVSNCSNALELALRSVGVRPGDVVLTVSHSFIATANCVRSCGGEPVFVDVDPETSNMSVPALGRVLHEDCRRRGGRLWYRHVDVLAKGESPLAHLRASRGPKAPIGRVAAIMPVHQAGMPCDMAGILRFARRHRIPVVEDAACALGSEILRDGSWRRIGAPHGDIACFSFHPRKIITTGEGGMLTTNSASRHRTYRLLRNHGMDLTDLDRHRSNGSLVERYLVTGNNFRMTDIQASIGLRQMERVREFVARRRGLAAAYAAALRGIPGVRMPQEPPYARTNWQTLVVFLEPPHDPRAAARFLLDHGVSTRRGVMCSHLEPPYAGTWPRGSLPCSEAASRSGLVLPMFPELTVAAVRRISDLLKRFCAKTRSC